MLVRTLYSDEIVHCGEPGSAGPFRSGLACRDVGRSVVSLGRFCPVLLVSVIVLFTEKPVLAGFTLLEPPESSEQNFFSANSLLAQVYSDLFNSQANVPMKQSDFGASGAGAIMLSMPPLSNVPVPAGASELGLAVGLIGATGRSSTSSSGQWNLGYGSMTTGLCSRILVPPVSGLWSWIRLSEFLYLPLPPNADVFRPPPARQNLVLL